jgi:integrase
MLYETCARAEEILGVNIEELDLAGRRCPVKAKGARPRTRRRGQSREDFVLEPVYWDAGTARLLPRLLKGRTCGPVFVTHRRPGPGKVVSPRDVCPDTGFARLSYGQARALLDEHTAVGGVPGTGWDLHEWRHSGLTHLGEAGASLLMLMTKSRHKKPENVRKYFHPSPEAIAEITSLLAPGGSRR